MKHSLSLGIVILILAVLAVIGYFFVGIFSGAGGQFSADVYQPLSQSVSGDYITDDGKMQIHLSDDFYPFAERGAEYQTFAAHDLENRGIIVGGIHTNLTYTSNEGVDGLLKETQLQMEDAVTYFEGASIRKEGELLSLGSRRFLLVFHTIEAPGYPPMYENQYVTYHDGSMYTIVFTSSDVADLNDVAWQHEILNNITFIP